MCDQQPSDAMPIATTEPINIVMVKLPKSKDPKYIKNPITRCYIRKDGSAHKILISKGLLTPDGVAINTQKTTSEPQCVKPTQSPVAGIEKK